MCSRFEVRQPILLTVGSDFRPLGAWRNWAGTKVRSRGSGPKLVAGVVVVRKDVGMAVRVRGPQPGEDLLLVAIANERAGSPYRRLGFATTPHRWAVPSGPCRDEARMFLPLPSSGA